MSRILSAVLDQANPNNIADALRAVPVGRALGIISRTVRVPVVANVAVLPDTAKAAVLQNVFVSAGTVSGQFSVVAPNVVPATTQAAINALGNVAFLPADAVTEAEITYVAVEGDIFTDTLTVATNVGLLPSGRKAKVILSATNTTGGGSSALTVLARGSANPAAGNTRIDTTGASLRFEGAVTSAVVRYVADPVQTVDAALRSSVDF